MQVDVLRAESGRLAEPQPVAYRNVNALRHGKGKVVISACDEGDAVVLSVRDHEPGVSPNDAAPAVLSPGQGRPGTDSVGLGLGLWTVRTLTEAHGGSVRYADAHPGAAFLVRLPADGG